MVNLIVLLLFAIFFIVDIYFDTQGGASLSHIWQEIVMSLLAIVAFSWQIKILLEKNLRISLLNTELFETKKSYQDWKEKTHTNAREIRQLIDEQFSLWQLSNSEKDVALLLIKGLSMKEIAEIRSTQEKTVRQQATSIYRKSALSGRQELAAFFLEDILSSPINS